MRRTKCVRCDYRNLAGSRDSNLLSPTANSFGKLRQIGLMSRFDGGGIG